MAGGSGGDAVACKKIDILCEKGLTKRIGGGVRLGRFIRKERIDENDGKDVRRAVRGEFGVLCGV